MFDADLMKYYIQKIIMLTEELQHEETDILKMTEKLHSSFSSEEMDTFLENIENFRSISSQFYYTVQIFLERRG